MKQRFKHLPKGALSLVCLCLISSSCRHTPEAPTVEYTLNVPHPGVETATAAHQTLYQTLNTHTGSIEYYIDTDSVYCSTGVCKVVAVRIVWNDIGNYLRYELPDGGSLEKAEGLPFTKADHQRLHEILMDEDSLLKSVAQVDIQNHESTDSDVDVETSATPPAYAGIAVEGAAWTTYTLWHWAHSPIQEDILKRARAASTPQTLRALLAEGSVAHKIFALNELTRRNDTTPETVQAIIQLDTEGSSDVVKAALDYWEQAPSSVLTASFVPFYHASSEQARIILLGAIRTSKLTLNATQLEQLSSQFSSAWSYQEVDLLFGLMEQIDPPSTEVVKQTLPLLQNKDFLTARRAYWYLSDHPALTAEQQVLLHHFEQKHEDRL